MKTLMIREVPDEIHAALVSEAKAERRSAEAQALHILETSLRPRAAETAGELLEMLARGPRPDVEVKAIDAYLATRGKRSNRPA